MKTIIITGCLLLSMAGSAGAQGYEIVIDNQHLASVVANGTVRSGAELTHENFLGKISGHIDDLNVNVGSVVLAQNIIYNALSNVNSALKDGLEVRNMMVIVSDMTSYINQSLTLAKGDPFLLLFAGQIAAEMRSRALKLVGDVSSFILKEGDNVLADYNARDQLLHHVIQQLQILDGLAYGAWKAMFWAKERGIIASLDPFAGYINRDKSFVSRIIQSAKYLQQ
jgi:hypothetical protein